MKRYTNMDIVAAVAGLVFIVFGVVMIVHPIETIMISPGPGRYRGIIGSDEPVHISKAGSQVYGGLSIAMGVGLGWCALFTGRKR